MSDTKEDWTGCSTGAGGVAQPEPKRDLLKKQVMMEVVLLLVVAVAAGGCELFLPSFLSLTLHSISCSGCC